MSAKRRRGSHRRWMLAGYSYAASRGESFAVNDQEELSRITGAREPCEVFVRSVRTFYRFTAGDG